MTMVSSKKKRRLTFRRKRSLDPTLVIDYKFPDSLKRFITDRGKIIPRRISGATASQQREIALAVKRARYLALLPFSVAHRSEKGFAGEMASVAAALSRPPRHMGPRPDQDESMREAPERDRDSAEDDE
jgi:small subunit ribosomal protein S18